MKSINLKTKLILASLLFMFSNFSMAACEDIISLSKESRKTVRERNDFEQQAKNFCSAEGLARTRNTATGGSMGYGPFEASGSQQNSSFDSSYANTCSADNSGGVRNDAYFNYVESIAPGAFQAYARCVELQEKTGVVFYINSSSITPTTLTIGVLNRTNIGNQPPHTIRYNAPKGITCSWNQGSNTKEFSIAPNHTVSLICDREDATSQTFIEMSVETAAQNSISFPWSAYQGDVRVDMLEKIVERIGFLENANAALLKGVVAFASQVCPAGWQPYEPAFGMFVRGIDKSKILTDPAGERKPGNIQSDAFTEHIHALNPSKIIIDTGDARTARNKTAIGGDYAFEFGEVKTRSSGTGKETRPKNVALLYCIRQ